MSIPKDLAMKRDEYLEPYSQVICDVDREKLCIHDIKCAYQAGVKAAFESEHVAGLVEALKVASKLLDEIKFELYGSVYTLTDDEFETTYFVRDECDRALAKWEKRND